MARVRIADRCNPRGVARTLQPLPDRGANEPPARPAIPVAIGLPGRLSRDDQKNADTLGNRLVEDSIEQALRAIQRVAMQIHGPVGSRDAPAETPIPSSIERIGEGFLLCHGRRRRHPQRRNPATLRSGHGWLDWWRRGQRRSNLALALRNPARERLHSGGHALPERGLVRIEPPAHAGPPAAPQRCAG